MTIAVTEIQDALYVRVYLSSTGVESGGGAAELGGEDSAASLASPGASGSAGGSASGGDGDETED